MCVSLTLLLLSCFNFCVCWYFVLEQTVAFNSNNGGGLHAWCVLVCVRQMRGAGKRCRRSLARHIVVSSRHAMRLPEQTFPHSALCGASPSTTRSSCCTTVQVDEQASDRRTSSSRRCSAPSDTSSVPLALTAAHAPRECVAATRARPKRSVKREHHATAAVSHVTVQTIRLLLPLASMPLTLRRQHCGRRRTMTGHRLQKHHRSPPLPRSVNGACCQLLSDRCPESHRAAAACGVSSPQGRRTTSPSRARPASGSSASTWLSSFPSASRHQHNFDTNISTTFKNATSAGTGGC